jgi:hypothetical protein
VTFHSYPPGNPSWVDPSSTDLPGARPFSGAPFAVVTMRTAR